jgi:hypothetical protein
MRFAKLSYLAAALSAATLLFAQDLTYRHTGEQKNRTVPLLVQNQTTPWSGYGHDAQHSGVSAAAAQQMNRIKWSTPVDTVLQGTTGSLFIHYGSPVITAGNTVLVPQRTSTSNTFQINAFDGASGAQIYTLPTDYTPPAHDWIPSYGAALALGTRYYYPGAGGTVYYRDSPDSATGASGQLAFYGLSAYQANAATFNSTVQISTPITADRFGNIFFGFVVSGSNPASLSSGLARIGINGQGSWVSAGTLTGNQRFQIPLNCAPALNAAGNLLYIAVSNGGNSSGYLVEVNPTTLTPINKVELKDPETNSDATILDDSSAAPMIGPDGDVYYGVFETSCCSNHDRGWLLHFNSTLATEKTPGAFGWDTTPTVVTKTLVPSYTGTSPYLVLTKYNNYFETGGNGQNYVAITDPNAAMTDPVTGVPVMKVVIEQLGPTVETGSAPPNARREWCINSAAIDPTTKSAIVNSEDGVNYRWDLVSNTLSQSIRLTPGVSEAYTPTVIGPDGTIYAINDATLFAIGQ